jgi:hypothetical protein
MPDDDWPNGPGTFWLRYVPGTRTVLGSAGGAWMIGAGRAIVGRPNQPGETVTGYEPAECREGEDDEERPNQPGETACA